VIKGWLLPFKLPAEASKLKKEEENYAKIIFAC